jgi:AcrR family transcriptional regulator
MDLATRTGAPLDAPGGTRERILAAAARTLSARGYAQTHLAEIARVAGLRSPAIYYYFGSRDELVAAVLREGQERVRTHVRDSVDRLPACSRARKRIATAVEAHLRLELELSDFASAVTRNIGHVPPEMRIALDRESAAFHGLWRDLLEDAEAEGALRPGIDLRVGRLLVIGALNWTAEWRKPTTSVDAIVATATSLVDAALFVPEPAHL